MEVNDEEDVKRNWENLKLKEGKKSVLGGVPKSLPATVKAMRLQEKAKQVGFEWENKDQVWEKVEEEMKELKEVIGTGQQDKGRRGVWRPGILLDQLCTVFAGGCRKCTGTDQQEIHPPLYPDGTTGFKGRKRPDRHDPRRNG